MSRGTRRLQVNRQQKHILLLALFLLKYQHGNTRPAKRQVLNLIDLHHLIQIRDEDRRRVATGEEAWANDITWRREDLKEEVLLTMPEHGEWQITASGERRIIEWCAIMHHFATVTPDWETRADRFEDLFEEKVVITKQTVLAAQRAYEIATRLYPRDLPEVPEHIKGKIRL